MNTIIVDLTGSWRYELDHNGCGVEEAWFERRLKNQGFLIPGTTASNNIGNKVIIEKQLTKEAVKCLRQESKYVGVVWYQTHFQIKEWNKDEAFYLYLERIIFQSHVWIDGNDVGIQDSLSVAHQYDITPYIQKGKLHTLTIRVDNQDIHNIGPYPSAYTDETQTIWNGIIGKVHIEKVPQQNFESMVVGMNPEGRVDLNLETSKVYNHDIHTYLQIKISDVEEILQNLDIPIIIKAGVKQIVAHFQLEGNIKRWDEFEPYLYDFSATIRIEEEIKEVIHMTRRMGFCNMDNSNGVLKINGVQRFLRGNIDCCVYPLTGYPPTTKNEWKKIYKVTQAYGLNHIRFHSWCPTEEAFEAADEMGIYLQVEAPMWMDTWTEYAVGSYKEHYTYLPEEAERIIRAYSWHPSFCIFSNGNELNGDFKLLEDMIKRVRVINPHIMYTLTTNWDRELNEQDDLFIAQSVNNIGIRGQYFLDKMVDGTELAFDEGIAQRKVPVISHEVGQYVVYPDVNEINKYTGVLKPTNFEVIKKDLEEKGLLKYAKQYIKASGKLANSLYKAELEAALRTKNMAGIQLLGLHDFPGQSTATIGLLNAFFESKGIIESKAFRSFCDTIVPLIKLPKFKYKTTEALQASITIANYSGATLKDVEIKVSIVTQSNKIIFEQRIHMNEIPVGVIDLEEKVKGKVFEQLKGRNKCIIQVEIVGTEKINMWDLWVYEPIEEIRMDNMYQALTEEVIDKLKQGETVILCPKPQTIKHIGPSRYFPVFWSPVHFVSKNPCGMIIDVTNPLFKKYYPVDAYGDYEWKVFLENTNSINIDILKDFEPLMMLVPNFFNNHKFTHIFEANIEEGKLIVCSFDFNHPVSKTPEIQYLKKALKDYIRSKDFAPIQRLSVEVLKQLFVNEVSQRQGKTDIAVYKPAYADSEKSMADSAIKGNDNNPSTAWSAADAEEGHYWQVDLEKIYPIVGNKIVFNEEANYMYVIHTSVDGENWTLVVNKTGQVTSQKVHEDSYECEARYIRITYNGLPNGIWAGHQQFSVYTD